MSFHEFCISKSQLNQLLADNVLNRQQLHDFLKGSFNCSVITYQSSTLQFGKCSMNTDKSIGDAK